MPKATVTTDSTRYNLNTLEGAWVELRPMSFGAKNRRTDIAMKMAFEGGGKKGKDDARGILEMSSESTTLFDFQQCVVDHNLFADDAETVKLNLASAQDLARLDPRIGEEIGQLIDSLNNVDQAVLDDLGNGFSS